MNKYDYLVYAFTHELYLNRAWGITVFTNSELTDDSFNTTGLLMIDGELGYLPEVNPDDKSFDKGSNNKIAVINGLKKDNPLLGVNEKVTLKKKDFTFINKDTPTTYGILFMNLLIFWFPYRGKVPYQNKALTGKLCNAIALEQFTDDNIIEHMKFEQGVNMLTAFSQVVVPSMSRRSITPNPKIASLKKKLLSAPDFDSNSPSDLAVVQKALQDADREYIKGDPSEGFFIKDKMYAVSRSRMFGMYGVEPDFYDETKFTSMTPSLSEGWGPENLPMLNNSTRSGSYNRGAMTALAGADIKTSARVFQNYNLSIDDCGTKKGFTFVVNEVNHSAYVGRYLVGKNVPLTLEQLKGLKGKSITLRSFMGCEGPVPTLCKRCAGDVVGASEVGLPSMITGTLSNFLLFFLALMHSTELTTARYKFKDRII